MCPYKKTTYQMMSFFLKIISTESYLEIDLVEFLI